MDALEAMRAQAASSLLITERIGGSRLVRDIFTEKDVTVAFPAINDTATVSDLKQLGRGVATATPDAIVLDALRFMLVSGIRHLPIVVPGSNPTAAMRSVYTPSQHGGGASDHQPLPLASDDAASDQQGGGSSEGATTDAKDTFETVLEQVLAEQHGNAMQPAEYPHVHVPVVANVTGRSGDHAPVVGILSMRDLVRFALLPKKANESSAVGLRGDGSSAPEEERKMAQAIAEHNSSLSASDSDSSWGWGLPNGVGGRGGQNDRPPPASV